MKIILFLYLFQLLVFSLPLYAQEKAGILILNSNVKVEKYAIVEEEFINDAASHAVVKLDLAGGSGNRSEVKKLASTADLIYCIGSKAYEAAMPHAKNKKILFSSIINWMRLPMTNDTYGISNELHTRMTILMFRSIFPELRKFGVLYSQEYTMQWFNDAKQQADELGLQIVGRMVSNSARTGPALAELLKDIDVFWLVPDPIVMSEKSALFEILEACDKRKIPVFSYLEAFAVHGAALIVSVDDATIGRQAAGMALDILSGAELTDKIQFPAGSSITLNMKKIEAYNIRYNEDALRMVNNIIK